MKRILCFVLVLLMICTLYAGVTVFAEEPATERVYNYSGETTADIWLSDYDEDDKCIGNAYVTFNAAASFSGAYLPHIWAGVKGNDQDADLRFELFRYDTDDEKTMKETPVFKKEQHFDGDVDDYVLPFGAVFPAGQYLFKITQYGDKGTAGIGRYTVLPRSGKLSYSESVIGSGPRGQFGFAIDFTRTEGISSYFRPLEGLEYDLEPFQTISEYIGGTAKSINDAGEFIIVTPEVPDGKALYSFTLTLCPTWGNQDGNSNLSCEVYKWMGDYTTSVNNGILDLIEITDHKDNSDLTLVFGTTCRYGSRYMLILTAPDGKIGYYLGSSDVPEGWVFFEGDDLSEITPACAVTYALVGDLGPEPTKEPEKTPEAAVTDAPADNPATPDNGGEIVVTLPPAENSGNSTESEKDSGSSLPVILGICGGVVVIAVIAVIVLKKRKKA